ncbi:HNH endonuclease [Natranaeroarchaeum sulfidigenes]|uniref:HNH family endonuclease n=1 Tax=Natranaeroarchaeum sulfidigenes TaxID=2784880 RepID=A0A897MU91_9EURY|nr:HNH endonuclease [Natranaeroarchaeum sulfidigenes]QSG04074.1 HNH family endonuclease [Natranaeroarchaeum sulfidigenes]
MTTEEQQVPGQRCQEWRVAYRDGKTPYELSVEEELPRRKVHDHLTGQCSHDGEEPPISRGRTHGVTAPECRGIRDRYAAGEAIEALQASTGRRWQTLVRHLTGACSHETAVEAPTVAKEEILRRDRVTAEECAQLRRGVRDADSVMAYADTVEHEYQAVLAHVNGECTHEIDAPPREPTDRSQDISTTECQTIRETYRSSPDTEVTDIAEEYGCSPTTIERHVTFRCSHPPVDALVTDVEAVQDILASGVEVDDGLSTLSSAEIVRLESAKNADRQEPARDLATPDPERVETTRSRVVRNTDLTHDMKRMYDHTCQVCGASRQGPDEDPYAEAHHIRPLGRPHDGPDEPENILVLCPNHHADFDYGRLTVDPETHRVTHTYEDAVDGTQLYIADPHELSDDHLTYHNRVIAGE